MEKIKRGSMKKRNPFKVFLKTVFVTALCLLLVTVGYFAAAYISALI